MIVKELHTFPEPNLTKHATPIEYYIDEDGCFICVSHCEDKDGYRKIYRDGKSQRLHRYTYKVRTDEEIDGKLICHCCDKPGCCNPDHCVAGDHVLNMQHRSERNRTATGEKNGSSKLTTEQVVEILEDQSSSPKRLALKYGVTAKHIREIKNGVIWKHIKRKKTVTKSKPKMAPSKPLIPGNHKLKKHWNKKEKASD
ncbi:MAG: hypothetical protein DAHOPDDO_00600 [Ignavibacteriaceae bacterium]|nr:hypothetical protein [Ignavibacteriaceae bacterium]